MTKPSIVLSFDIGIKNMAYCVLSVNEETTRILDWTVIDISKNDEEVVVLDNVCGCKNKMKLCKSKVKYEKNGLFYCGKHAKITTEYIIPEKRFTISQLKKKKVIDLEMIIKEFCIESCLTDNSKINKNETIVRMDSFFNTKCFNIAIGHDTLKAQNIDLITLGRNMTRILDKTPNLENISHVILENQISTLASRMKTIQGMLAQYFIMRFGDSIHIEFVSSSNKLKGFPKRNDMVFSNNYKNNKSDAIYYTNEILLNNINLNLSSPVNGTKWVDSLNLKKKDDLCDCFLQGIWYLQKMKYIVFDEDYIISNRLQVSFDNES